jgi:BolA protein
MTVKQNIEKKLNIHLQPTMLEVIDESDLHIGHEHARPEGESHFRVRVASPLFANLSRVQAHRMVHDIIKEELEGPIHALALETIRP